MCFGGNNVNYYYLIFDVYKIVQFYLAYCDRMNPQYYEIITIKHDAIVMKSYFSFCALIFLTNLGVYYIIMV